jgi:hypothetical protein
MDISFSFSIPSAFPPLEAMELAVDIDMDEPGFL